MIEIVKLGSVSSVALIYIKDYIYNIIDSFSLDPRNLRLVIVESREHLDSFFDELFGRNSSPVQLFGSVSHIYVCGKPTIFIIASELYDKNESVLKGEFLIALAHAKLHNSEEYYIIRFPKKIQKLLESGAPKSLATTALHLIASGVKGYEATCLVVEKGYLKEMEEMYNFHLKITPQEKLSWIMAEGNLQAQALLTLNSFKILANALPVYRSTLDSGFKELFEQNLNMIPLELRPAVEETLFNILPQEYVATLDKVESCVGALIDVIYRALL